jgi:hypothetical protein
VTNVATDTNVPTPTLTFTLPTAPTNATINSSSGIVTWRPYIAQANSTNAFTVTVTDNDSPAKSASQSFTVYVNPATSPTNSLAAYTNGIFSMEISGIAGPNYIIQVSTNLSSTNWQTLYTTNPATLPFTFTDTNASNYTAQFYRVLLGP